MKKHEHCYLIEVVDSVHIGSGGYRLGRVDNSIIREPSTRIPKIPGTTINGAARFFADFIFQKNGKDTGTCAGSFDEEKSCLNPEECPVCYTFGYTRAKKGKHPEDKASMGTVAFSDAQIVLFPVYTFSGVYYITTENILQSYFNLLDIKLQDNNSVITNNKSGKINLGWLFLNAVQNNNLNKLKEKISSINSNINNFAVVSEKLFSIIVNDNLEVRTSVSIDPETGAAKEGALFTYEAIPRGTVLMTKIYENDYKEDFKNVKKFGLSVNSPIDVVKESLEMFSLFGFGGMKTRGFGRVIFHECEV